MSSGSKRAWLLASVIAAVGLGCEAAPTSAVAQPPTVTARVPVGPLPGLDEYPGDAANPLGADPSVMRDGRRVFTAYNCAGCHGDHGGGGMGPSLRDERWFYGSSDAQIARSIVDGRAFGMPAWGEMLTDEQVWQVTAYIRSMRSADEPDRPQ